MERQLPRPPALPVPIPFTSTQARERHPRPAGTCPAVGSLSCSPYCRVSGAGMLGLPQDTSERSQPPPIFPAVEWDCLSRRWEQQWGQHATSPGPQTLLSNFKLTSCSLSLNVSTGHQTPLILWPSVFLTHHPVSSALTVLHVGCVCVCGCRRGREHPHSSLEGSFPRRRALPPEHSEPSRAPWHTAAQLNHLLPHGLEAC